MGKTKTESTVGYCDYHVVIRWGQVSADQAIYLDPCASTDSFQLRNNLESDWVPPELTTLLLFYILCQLDWINFTYSAIDWPELYKGV